MSRSLRLLPALTLVALIGLTGGTATAGAKSGAPGPPPSAAAGPAPGPPPRQGRKPRPPRRGSAPAPSGHIPRATA